MQHSMGNPAWNTPCGRLHAICFPYVLEVYRFSQSCFRVCCSCGRRHCRCHCRCCWRCCCSLSFGGSHALGTWPANITGPAYHASRCCSYLTLVTMGCRNHVSKVLVRIPASRRNFFLGALGWGIGIAGCVVVDGTTAAGAVLAARGLHPSVRRLVLCDQVLRKAARERGRK